MCHGFGFRILEIISFAALENNILKGFLHFSSFYEDQAFNRY
jgi:hypothetical protein